MVCNFYILLKFIYFKSYFNIYLIYNSDYKYYISKFKLDRYYLLVFNNKDRKKYIVSIIVTLKKKYIYIY